MTNLLNILAAFEGRTIQELESEVREWNMRRFKERVAQSVVDGLKDIQRRYEEVSGDRGWLERARREGNERAREVASQRISQIKRIVGLL